MTKMAKKLEARIIDEYGQLDGLSIHLRIAVCTPSAQGKGDALVMFYDYAESA